MRDLCERLIRAYSLAAAKEPPLGGLWAEGNLVRARRGLVDVLERGDAAQLEELLAAMFRQTFIDGIANYALDADFLVRLGEYLALVPAACPEIPSKRTVDLGLLADCIEARIGIPFDFPAIGQPRQFEIDGRCIPSDTPFQLYGAMRLRQAAADCTSVVEIGGGYGGMMWWFDRLGDPVPYTIIDLPFANVLQGYFLSLALGEEHVSLYGESPKSRVQILPTSELHELGKHDVLVNQNSLPEIDHPVAVSYLTWARDNVQRVFYSHNQESEVAGQGVVYRLVDEVGGFQHLARERSWVRPGYVEDIYAPKGRRA